MCEHPEIKRRPKGAFTGSQLVQRLVEQNINFGERREEILLAEYLTGNVPKFMRTLYPLEVSGDGGTLVVYSLPDYLCVGTDDDFVHTPMAPATAQRIANAWGLVLGTPEMEDARRRYFPQKLGFRAMAPPTYPRNSTMMNTERWAIHTRWFLEDMVKKGYKVGEPVTGHKKCNITHAWLATWGFTHCGVHGAYYAGSDRPIHVFEDHAKAHIPEYTDYSHGSMLYHPSVFYPNDGGDTGVPGKTINERLMSEAHRPLSRRRFTKHPGYPV